LVSTALVGCRNRVAEERDELWRQSRAQQEELDKRNAELEAMRKAQASKPATPPAPAAVAPVTPPPAPTPAPPPPQQVAPIAGLDTTYEAGAVTVSLPGDIFFNSGEATIRTPAQDSLKKDKTYAGKPIRVEGHTDSDPIKKSKWKSNQELSEARAKSVKDYLGKQGIDPKLITSVGHGADMPKGADKSRNRRVEVVVLVDATAAAAHKAPAKPAVAAPVDNGDLNK
jgi:flagellar motor protein MotB